MTMAEKQNNNNSSVNCWWHIKVLYLSNAILLLALVGVTFVGHLVVKQQKQDLELEIQLAAKRYVDFNPDQFGGDSAYYAKPPPDVDSDDDVTRVQAQQLVRIKRRALRHGDVDGTEHARRDPSYIRDPPANGESDLPDDWVWLTSYTRIPVSAHET